MGLVVARTVEQGRLVAQPELAALAELVAPVDHSPERSAVGYRRKLDKLDKLERPEWLELARHHSLNSESRCFGRRNQGQDRGRAW